MSFLLNLHDLSCPQNILNTTDEYPETLINTISAIRNALPGSSPLLQVETILLAQAQASTAMAGHLESLTAHYDQMAATLRESEAGEVFSEEDLQGQCSCNPLSFFFTVFVADMNRDTEELPAIMGELEESVSAIEASQYVALRRSHLSA